ncbi:MAG: IS66 family transposase [Gemmatimonadaceae bacterium]
MSASPRSRAEIRRVTLASGYVHLDATPIDCCDRTQPGKAQTALVWTYRAGSPDPAVHGLMWYDFQLTKTPREPARILTTYRGVVQTDGRRGSTR